MRPALEVLLAFLKLGLTSFGGPVGHLGYFCSEFVVRRQWLPERAFSDLVAFCQFLPGPASSQVGFSIGLLRASYGAALAAWLGFTLPSVVAIVCFAVLSALAGTAGEGPLHGLTLVAGLVVAQAVIGMGRKLRPDSQRALIAIVAALIALIAPGYFADPTTIAFGAADGLSLCRALPESAAWTVASPVSRRTALGSVALFVALLVAPPILHRLNDSAALARADAFYRSGAHVFGGSHIVLPLLLEALVAPGWVADRTFLAGCGAAQACPGRCLQSPRISARLPSRRPRVGRRRAGLGLGLGLVSIFLPGLLLVTDALPFWSRFRSHPRAESMLRGVNAAVVELLGAALYSPV